MTNHKLQMAVLGCCLAFGSAHALTHAEYRAEKNRFDSEYKAARAKCNALKGDEKGVCVGEAKAAWAKAKAAAQVGYTGTPKEYQKMMEESAEADYNVAKEKCDALKGNDKDVCIKEAKAVRVAAVENIKAHAKISDARADANKEKMEAEYKVAKEKCDAHSGAAKDKCVADAKLKYKQ